MNLSKFKDFFKKKEGPKNQKDFDIDEFNEWFKTEFEGYEEKALLGFSYDLINFQKIGLKNT